MNCNIDEKMKKWILKMPKVDLHCHLDGSLSINTIRNLAVEAKLQLPESDEKLVELLQTPDNCRSLEEYLKRFDLPLLCLQSKRNLYNAAYCLAKEASQENVIYLEIRFAPFLSVNEHLDARSVVSSVIEGLKQAEKDFNIVSNVILCGLRHFTIEKNIELVNLAKEFLGSGVCAIDLAGDEKKFPPLLHGEMFRIAESNGIPFTIHAGECGSASNVMDSISLGASRIGHGIAMQFDDKIMQACVDKKICIEMCPSSNVQTKAVKSMKEYPIKQFLDCGVIVTINTDNRMVSNTSLTKELTILENEFAFTTNELTQLMLNSVFGAFTSESVKSNLIHTIHSYYESSILV